MRDENNREVTVVDIQMSFWSIVVFLIKLAIASIPAMIILWILTLLLSRVMGGLLGEAKFITWPAEGYAMCKRCDRPMA